MSDDFRAQYRKLTPAEAEAVAELKALASSMREVLAGWADCREGDIAKVKLEEAVMWGVKGITG